MHDEARRMQRLIDDLISLSRIEAEKYRAPDNPVDLAELIDEVMRRAFRMPARAATWSPRSPRPTAGARRCLDS
jgi:two-component system phosphate regulon sensor histidine kinase PhoR